MDTFSFKAFPIPVVSAVGPGSQGDETPEYLPMPRGMDTWRAPVLPEADELAAHAGCLEVLHEAVQALRRPDALQGTRVIDLAGLGAEDRRLLNQVLGEGEVSAQVIADAQPSVDGEVHAEVGMQESLQVGVQVQESVFAGVWRVVHRRGGQVLCDTLEIGALPQPLVRAAAEDAARARVNFASQPPGVMNSPALLAEVEEHSRTWREGQAAHVLNLSLLPLLPEDSAHLEAELGAGRVVILSRGYGNCRITNTRAAHTWRVTYFNSTDIIILDTLEVCRVPEVACAAAEDLEDSAERLAEVLQWVGGPAA